MLLAHVLCIQTVLILVVDTILHQFFIGRYRTQQELLKAYSVIDTASSRWSAGWNEHRGSHDDPPTTGESKSTSAVLSVHIFSESVSTKSSAPEYDPYSCSRKLSYSNDDIASGYYSAIHFINDASYIFQWSC